MPLIQGTAGADTLQGTAGADTIDGSAGDDRIDGGAGDDLLLIPGGGYDTLLGGEGDDRFLWRRGEDFILQQIDGGAGRDTIDFTGHEAGFYVRSRSLVLQDGPQTNSILGHVTGYNGLFSPGLDQDFLTAPSVERIIGSDISIELDGFTAPLEIISLGGGRIWTGSGDDTITLTTRVRATFDGSQVRTLYPSEINGGGGVDRLNLENQASDYFFAKTSSGWSIYDGRTVVHQVSNIETVSFAGGAAMTVDAAASGADFDAAGYLARYADLRAAFGTDEAKAYQHWKIAGEAEGRIGSFDALSYIASYRDLIDAYGANASAGAYHYMVAGVNEGRVVTFDPAAYAASNPDLARVIGTDAVWAASHYINNGVHEGRVVAGFDSVAYLLSNPDLTGLSPAQARTHWLTTGADQDRVGDALFGREQTAFSFTGSSTIGQFETAADRDWFAITLPVYQTITFNGSAGVAGLAVYNSTGRLIASDADGRDFQFFISNSDGAYGPAPYYLVATGGSVGSYSITVTTRPLNAAPEASEALQHAAALALKTASTVYAQDDGVELDGSDTASANIGWSGEDWMLA